MNIYKLIKDATKRSAGHAALIEGGDRISYEELVDAVERVAASLGEKGVDRFHRVGLLCADSIDYVIVSLAILSISAVIVPIAPEQSRNEIDTVVERIDLDFLIAESGLLADSIMEPFESAGLIKKSFRILKRAVAAPPGSEYFRMNPAFIRFSSGTTGASKGVLLSHESIIDRTDAADKGLHITSEDVVLWVLSMSFHFVVTILLFLRRGATIVLCGHQFPESLIDGIKAQNGTFIYASPFHYALLARSSDLSMDDMKNIRLAVSTAMKLPTQVAEEFRAKFGRELNEAYGIIEVGLPFIRIAGGGEGSLGKALPDYAIMLDQKDDDGVGEIFIKGKGMLDAYYSPWQTRDEILENGWFRTGDLGSTDEEGCLTIKGRAKDVINFVGMKIFAQEVEDVINQYPGVIESLVFGQPHPRYGELPVAKVVVDSGGDDAAFAHRLRKFCYQRLAQYKVPKEFTMVASLPKTASGKIIRRKPC